ncbi:hypothetical protein PFISCL1PPCAC_16766, partial [Pristionchus fissidentatus]
HRMMAVAGNWDYLHVTNDGDSVKLYRKSSVNNVRSSIRLGMDRYSEIMKRVGTTISVEKVCITIKHGSPPSVISKIGSALPFLKGSTHLKIWDDRQVIL